VPQFSKRLTQDLFSDDLNDEASETCVAAAAA